MRRIILIISVLMILSGASYAGFHLGLGKAAVKKSADVIEEAVAKSTAAAGGGTGGGSSSGSSGSLTAPANVSIASVYRASFTITWNDQGNLAGVLYQAQASSDSFNAIAASTLTAQTSVAFESLGFDYSYSARVRSVKDNQQSDWTAAVSTTTRLPHCGTGPLFSTAPLDLAAIQFILPIGNPNPPGHTWPTAHNYYFFKSTGIYYPLYAPADGVINAVGSPGGPNVDYKLSFQSCGEVLVFYDHITSFTPVMA
ncbi:MAG: fibronectin type III domain-containing protein, partial [Elusimicrobia bacterium]|nr:fibronectin type III domain-containing protein [Elusimicrobiota bacterium]